MTLTNYDWKQDREDEQGFYFVLTDTLHHLDYNVLLIKDNGQIMVNGDYINNVPQSLAAAIAPRIDYFMAMNKLRHNHPEHHHEEKKPEPKKSSEPKKSEKKEEKKPEKKKEEKKPEKKDDKKGKK